MERLFHLCIFFAICSMASCENFPLTSVDYNDLIQLKKSTSILASHLLSNVGIIKISNIPSFGEANIEAFSNMPNCFHDVHHSPKVTSKEQTDYAFFSSKMDDGSLRLSVGTAVKNGVAGEINLSCSSQSKRLRLLVDMAMRQLFVALDYSYTLSKNNDDPSRVEFLMKPYSTFQELIDRGEHIEHFHVYYNGNNSYAIPSTISSSAFASTTTSASASASSSKLSSASSRRKTLDVGSDSSASDSSTIALHTDMGLMIAMTCGYYSHAAAAAADGEADELDSNRSGNPNLHGSRSRGLYVQVPDGTLAQVQCTSNDLIVMAGYGGQHWLAPRMTGPLHAVSHALYAKLGTDPHATRAWYGKMFLPPADAELYGFKETYGTYRKAEIRHVSASQARQRAQQVTSSHGAALPTACDDYAATATVDGTEASSAMSVNSADNSNPWAVLGHGKGRSSSLLDNVGSQSPCVDDSGNPGITCWAKCAPIPDKCTSDNAYCADPSTGQPVDGDVHDPSYILTCPNATVGERGYCASPGTSMSMTGFTTQADSFQCFVLLFPAWTLDSSTKFFFGCVGTILLGVLIHYLTHTRQEFIRSHLGAPPSVWRSLFVLAIYSAQIVLSYAVMLIAMTYNYELFFCVCFGLVLGFALFSRETNGAAFITHTIWPKSDRKEDMASLISPVQYHAINNAYAVESSALDPCCPPEYDPPEAQRENEKRI